jgi:hypothetical protein
MPQLTLPMLPADATPLGDKAAFAKRNGRWIYYLGLHQIYEHPEGDDRMFKVVAAQLISNGICRHRDVVKTFGVSKSSVNRALKKYRSGGIDAFYQKREGGRRGTVLTEERLERAQRLLDRGSTRREAAEELEIPKDTLRKAINDGRLVEGEKAVSGEAGVGSDKSSRSLADAGAAVEMGTACIRAADRVAASLGGLDGAETRFEACLDVPRAGVLCALPALLSNGLLDGVSTFLGSVKGYYTVFHILLTLAFASLCRIKTVEDLRGSPPGEFGKILGLDRIPEARCLRMKMDDIGADRAAEKWAAHLCGKWMLQESDDVGVLLVDGHVRVYNGKSTELPRRYVARQRLCLRATTDYWVNDALGRPFFVVEKPVDPGLLKTLEYDIVPRLVKDVPNQPSEELLEENRYACRFLIVFDREGYSPAFFGRMWRESRIACVTYHKFPGDPWPEELFVEREVAMPNGETVSMRLAERGSLVGSGKDAIWMREIRKLTESGHQTSLISTAFEMDHVLLAACMFTRWCQENFFRYMRRHFGIDALAEYGVEDLPDTEPVVNPRWREMDRSRNRLRNRLRCKRAAFAATTMHPETEDDPEKYKKWIEKKSKLLETIEQTEKELDDIKREIKEIPKRVAMGDLDEADRFRGLSSGRKRLLDTIKMVAYRAETAMAQLLKSSTVDGSEARRLLLDLFNSEADILPDPENKVLRVRVHNASRPAANRSLAAMFEVLNETKTNYPGTDLEIYYDLVF